MSIKLDATGSYLVRKQGEVVEAWATERLKYGPPATSWHRRFRDDLGQKIRELEGESKSLLAATYASALRDRCDTENIVFYNVGGSCFGKVAQRGLRLERSFEYPPVPSRLVAPALHYHRYERGVPGEPFSHWRQGDHLATFADVALPRLTADTKPVAVWLPVRRAALNAPFDREFAGPFVLRLHLRAPILGLNAANLIKPLLDGVIAAFQRYAGPQLDEVSARLASQVPTPVAEVAALLGDRRVATLGSSTLVLPRKNGVQWQPADDRCVASELAVEPTSAADGFLLRGTILEALRWA